jgi:hypothetical protein
MRACSRMLAGRYRSARSGMGLICLSHALKAALLTPGREDTSCASGVPHVWHTGGTAHRGHGTQGARHTGGTAHRWHGTTGRRTARPRASMTPGHQGRPTGHIRHDKQLTHGTPTLQQAAARHETAGPPLYLEGVGDSAGSAVHLHVLLLVRDARGQRPGQRWQAGHILQARSQ